MQVMRLIGLFLAVGLLSLARAEEREVFGRESNAEAGLIGILYDFKQTQKRQPTGVKPPVYERIVEEFLRKDWSESVLNRYFRATRPLYTTQIFIPLMDAGEAPRAFGMQDVIKPAQWVVYYKGQVSPPEDGNYRFLAYSDDFMAVAVNGRTVCIGARFDPKTWRPTEKGPRVAAANGNLTYGDWIPLKKDEPIDLDVIIGECPGGLFCAFLLYEKQGVEYPKDAVGQPKYPLFQLAPHSTPVGTANTEPPFSLSPLTWKGHQ
jgi:hypothetical protein